MNDFQRYLAEEFAERGELARAQDAIAQARTIEPTYYRVWLRSAVIAMQARKYDEAMNFAYRASCG